MRRQSVPGYNIMISSLEARLGIDPLPNVFIIQVLLEQCVNEDLNSPIESYLFILQALCWALVKHQFLSDRYHAMNSGRPVVCQTGCHVTRSSKRT